MSHKQNTVWVCLQIRDLSTVYGYWQNNLLSNQEFFASLLLFWVAPKPTIGFVHIGSHFWDLISLKPNPELYSNTGPRTHKLGFWKFSHSALQRTFWFWVVLGVQVLFIKVLDTNNSIRCSSQKDLVFRKCWVSKWLKQICIHTTCVQIKARLVHTIHHHNMVFGLCTIFLHHEKVVLIQH